VHHFSFYEFVSDPGITWTAQSSSIEASTYSVQAGYLVAITSAEMHLLSQN
jgi:hypothetical protein